jgi:hypothetical protein
MGCNLPLAATSPGTLRSVGSLPSFRNEWTTPLPPRLPGIRHRTIRGGRVAVGVVAALAGHALTVGLGFADANVNTGLDWFSVWLLGQLVLGIGVIVAGVLQLARGDRGIGLGVFIGWAAGFVLTLVITYIVFVVAVEQVIPD